MRGQEANDRLPLRLSGPGIRSLRPAPRNPSGLKHLRQLGLSLADRDQYCDDGSTARIKDSTPI